MAEKATKETRYAIKPGATRTGEFAYGTSVHEEFDDWLHNQTCPTCKAEPIYGTGTGQFICPNGHLLTLELRP